MRGAQQIAVECDHLLLSQTLLTLVWRISLLVLLMEPLRVHVTTEGFRAMPGECDDPLLSPAAMLQSSVCFGGMGTPGAED